MTHASGVGSWPGTSAREAVITVRDLLSEPGGLPEGGGLPYLPELPSRGPGADIIGRSAALLADLSVDLQPSGWRFTDRPGRDLARARSLWRRDLDELAEAYDGYAGRLKIQIAGPWTLAASIELNRGERALTDEGARRDVIGSLAEGVRRHVAEVQNLVPGAVLVLQIDEPSVLSVLRGELPTASGYGRVRAVDRAEVARGIREVREAHDGDVVLHSCHPAAPVELLASTGASALALDLTHASPQRWEAIAEAVEAGTRLWAGVVPTAPMTSSADTVRAATARVVDGFSRVGLPLGSLAEVTITPTCGLVGLTPQEAVGVHRAAVDVARELTETGLG